MLLLAVSGYDVLALLYVSDVLHYVILNMALLPLLLLRDLLTLVLNMVFTVRTSTEASAEQANVQEGGEDLHVGNVDVASHLNGAEADWSVRSPVCAL